MTTTNSVGLRFVGGRRHHVAGLAGLTLCGVPLGLRRLEWVAWNAYAGRLCRACARRLNRPIR